MNELPSLRICHVGPYPARGGGIASVTKMLVTSQSEDPDLAVETISTSVDGGWNRKLITFASSCLAVRRFCKTDQPKILHIHTSHTRSFARKARLMDLAAHYKVPVLLHVHGSEFDKWYEAQKPGAQRSIRRRLDRVARVVVVSDSWNDYVSRLTETPVITIHNAVDVDQFAFDRDYGDHDPFLLLFLGGVGLKRKGVFDLFAALERITQTNPSVPLRLVVAGHGEIDEAKKWCRNHGMAEIVEVSGWIDHAKKDRLLREASVFVLPSYHEGLPIALLESMASGLPIVISPVGGIPEAIADHKNGLFVAPGNVDELADALQQVIEQPGLRARLGGQARTTARESFDLRVAADAFKRLYLEIDGRAAVTTI